VPTDALEPSDVASLDILMNAMSENPDAGVIAAWATVLKVSEDAVKAYVHERSLATPTPTFPAVKDAAIAPILPSYHSTTHAVETPNLIEESRWPTHPGAFARQHERQESLSELLVGMHVETIAYSLIPDASDGFRLRSHERRERSKKIMSEDHSVTGYTSFDLRACSSFP